MIDFACPACNRKLSFADQFAGRRGTCPHCKKTLLFPAPAFASVPVRPDVSTVVAANPAPLAEMVTVARWDDTPSSPDVAVAKLDFLACARQADELGRLGSYRVLKVLGVGGMGMVLQAEDLVLKRRVALKVMRPELAADPSNRQRFLREAQAAAAAAAIEHHHIVHINQVGEANGVPFIVMPLLKGEPLDARLKREKRLSIAEAVGIGEQIADGLAAAHKQGLIHRDIKPANIWLEEESDWVKIVDFGLARSVMGDDVQLTKTGDILGTPAYMAPEQARSEKVDFRCDLFSLGAVLYRMLTGELPFKSHDTMSLLMALAMDEPRPITSINPDVPQPLADLVMQLLAKEPGQRPPSAKTVAEKLSAMAGEGTMPRNSPLPCTPERGVEDEGVWLRLAKRLVAPFRPLRPWAFQRRKLAFAVAGGALVLLLLLVALPSSVDKRLPQDLPSREREQPENFRPEKEITNSLGMKFRLIPQGKFVMGSPAKESDRCLKLNLEPWVADWFKSEVPEHEVEIARPFYLGATEVTVGQFRQFVKENKYPVGDDRWTNTSFEQSDDHPVVWVTWHNAVDFYRWLSAKEAKDYRLPTEAEWEYSCRAGTSTRYSFGDDEDDLSSYAWINTNAQGRTHPAGDLKPNPWGLYDMHGNVYEWCQDAYAENYYKTSPKQDPPGGAAGMRMVRGGSWFNDSARCRSAFRAHLDPGIPYHDIGFRVAQILSSPNGVRP